MGHTGSSTQPCPQPTLAAPGSPFFRITAAIASVVRDIGVIVGIPVVVAVGMKLYDVQLKSFEAQSKAFEQQVKADEAQIKLLEAQNSVLKETHEAQMKALAAQNDVLKETQFPRALDTIKAQREIYENERASFVKQIEDLKTERASATTQSRQEALDHTIGTLESNVSKIQQECFKQIEEMLISKMLPTPEKGGINQVARASPSRDQREEQALQVIRQFARQACER
jgi:H2-forming N5,N10-methylenetetrahydromethanopterin dehydrogenase-like enzyme